MCNLFRRVCVIGTGAVVAWLMLATAAAAQGSTTDSVHNARQLGGATSFNKPALRTAASLKQMVAKKGMADDIRKVLRDSGIPETADAVLATLSGATTTLRGASCDMATPADGNIVECDVQPGTTMVWMAYRPGAARGNRTPDRIVNLRWAGAKPFKAFLFRVTNDYRIYTFILPLVCSNLTLVSVNEMEGEPVDVSIDRVCDPATGSLRATIKAGSKDLGRVQRVNVAINGKPAGELSAPSWTLVATTPGDYTFEATDRNGRSYPMTRRSIPQEACPPPPPPMKQVVGPTCSVVLSAMPAQGGYQINVDATRSTTGTSTVAPTVTVELHDDAGTVVGQRLVIDNTLNGTITVRRPGTYHATATVSTPQAVEVGTSRYEGSATCEASVTIEKPAGGVSFFFDALGGKERRVRPIEDTDLEFAQCSPLLGAKFGVAKRFGNDWEVAGAGGVAISLVTADDKVREHAVFIDAEVNKYLSSGIFIGTGLSLWDLTRSDTWTPAWLLHFGVPLTKHPRHPVYFFGEGRLFLDDLDNPKNNYLVWGGVRVHLRP